MNFASYPFYFAIHLMKEILVLNKWVVACRLRTLPLSSSAVILGLIVAFTVDGVTADLYHLLSAFTVLLTAVLLQILSNYANDFGDQISGVDKVERPGRISMVQQGKMTMRDLKVGIAVLLLLALGVGLTSIILCWYQDPVGFSSFVILGALAAVAAVTYTVGPSYSYVGLGDLFVFIFFGLVAVIGAEYMLSHVWSVPGVLAGVAAGCSSIMVLNVNNLRDYECDTAGGKKSVVVRIGLRNGRRYHICLFAVCVLMTVASAVWCCSWAGLAVIPFFIPLYRSVVFIADENHSGSVLEPMMKLTSLGASLVNLALGILLLVSV